MAVPAAQQGALPSVQAAPPLVERLRRTPARPKSPVAVSTPSRLAYTAGPRQAVRTTPARRAPKVQHRSAVIRRLAPTAPLVRARVLAAVSVRRQVAPPAKATSTAKTIAALAASLGTK